MIMRCVSVPFPLSQLPVLVQSISTNMSEPAVDKTFGGVVPDLHRNGDCTVSVETCHRITRRARLGLINL